ncbi:MAG: flagellar basal body L-ring protein FlgH [Nitrospinota bacterium]|nr:MAG: flagellar basal body L-ring protein FlgH [Nitrospinota bacterium]
MEQKLLSTQAGTVLILLLALLWGCGAPRARITPIDREVFRTPAPPERAPESEGSLFPGENRHALLFIDRKAHLVNDIVTIRITETASASGEAKTETDRSSSVSGSLDAVFGFERTLQNNKIDPSAVLETDLSHSFDGSGATTRKNSLSATITAVVREVFPNGNLYIEGRKEVIINNERQYIIISGVIRPEDILPDNSIPSDLIANARIEYSGQGVVADKQRPGWLGRIIDVVWPF